jgi:HD-GYP domain-containing protein (c-di-GMP phosphodiesterase class II)
VQAGARLAELLAAVSMAADLGMGQQMGYSARTAFLAARLAGRLGLPEAERADALYTGLLISVGCVGNAHEVAREMAVDDVALAGVFTTVAYASPGTQMREMVRHIGSAAPLPARVGVLARTMSKGKAMSRRFARAFCDVGRVFAERLELSSGVGHALLAITERWDGSGRPEGLRGDTIPVLARLVGVAFLAEGFRAAHGSAGAVEAVRAQAGSALDPGIASAFLQMAEAEPIWLALDAPSFWTDLLDLEPAPRRELDQMGVDDVITAFADFADLKSPFTVAHSRGVARLAEDAGRRMGLGSEADALRRAALLHDLGRVSLSNTILDKPRALNEAERERVRLHAYYSERILGHSAPLAPLATLAGAHHERLDGSGYHRASRGAQLSPAARVLAAADVCHALGEERPYRAALPMSEAERALRAEAVSGRLDSEAVEAVLAARRGGMPRRVSSSHLTGRELEVVALLARGRSNKEIAALLGISEKTTGHHIENAYEKLGVSTRVAAVMRALDKGLLPFLSPMSQSASEAHTDG